MREMPEGIRSCIQTIDPYVPGKPIEEVQRELGIIDIVKLASNENPLGPAHEARQAVAELAGKLGLYPDASGYSLREALAQTLRLPASQILIGNGSDDINKIVGETLINPGDEVVIPHPTFSQYEYVTRLMDGVPVKVAARQGLGNDLEALRRAITPRTKMVYICNPNNPTGTLVSNHDLRMFLSSIPQNIWVVLDEAYHEFADDPACPDGVELVKSGFENLVVYRTFSKVYGLAGIRLGYCIAAAELIATMMRVKEPFNVNLLAQAAGVAALGAKDHLRQSRELVWNEKVKYYRELDRMKVTYLPTQANFILIHCGRDSQPITLYLMRHGIIVRPTHSFGLPEHIRVSFGTPAQNERFLRSFATAMVEA